MYVGALHGRGAIRLRLPLRAEERISYCVQDKPGATVRLTVAAQRRPVLSNGASDNVIEAIFIALTDSIEYMLMNIM